MDLRQLRSFVALARTSSFTRAAAELYIVQSALSQQIARLEAELGVRLVERTSRRVRLTEAGEHLAARAEVLLRLAEELEAEIAEFAGAVRGPLRLGMTQGIDGVVDLAGLLHRFATRRPEVTLSVKADRTVRVATDVVEGRLDLGVVGSDLAGLPDGLAGVELGREELAVVVAADHPLAGRDVVDLAEVAAAGPVIDPAEGTRLRQIVDTAWTRAGARRTAVMQVLEFGQMLRYAALGIGSALIPLGALRAAVAGEPFRVLRLAEPVGYPVTLVFRAPSPSGPAARELLVDLAELIGPDTVAGRALRRHTAARPGPQATSPGRGTGARTRAGEVSNAPAAVRPARPDAPLPSGGSRGTGDAVGAVEDANKKLVAEFMEVFSAGDVDRILSYLDESATWWVAGTMEGISGTKDKAAFGQLLGGIADGTTSGAITLTPLAWTAEGERVAVETESYAELKNGRVYNNLYHFVFVVRDGKIHGVKEFLDTQHTAKIFLAP